MQRTVLLSGLMLLLSIAAQAQWTQTSGPEGAELRGVVGHGNTLIAFATNGVYHRVDGRWERVSDHESNLPGNPVVVGDIVLTSSGRHLYRSSDLGRSWRPVQPPFEPSMLPHIQWMAHRQTLYAAFTDTLFSTTDGGLSWTATPTPNHIRLVSITDDAIVAIETQFGFSFKGMIRSTDGGMTWEDISAKLPGDVHSMEFFPESRTGLYVGLGDAIYHSSDAGERWERLVELPQALADGAGIAIDVRSNDNIFLVIQPGNLTGYRDVYHYDGTEWKLVHSLGYGSSGSIITDAGLVLSTRSGLYMAEAATARWTSLNQGLRASTNVDFATIGGTTFTTAPDGVWSTTNGGGSWTRVADAVVRGIAADGETILRYGEGIHRSTDLGATWERVDTLILNDVDMHIAWVTGLGAGDGALYVTEGYTSAGEHGQGGGWVAGGVYRSDDNGRSWRNVSGGLPHNGLTTAPVVQIFVEKEYVIVNTAGGMFRSTNKGASWMRVSGPPVGASEYVQGIFQGERSLIAATSSGAVHRSTDGGASWRFLGSLPAGTYVNRSYAYDGGGVSEVDGEIFVSTQRAYRDDSVTWRYEHRVFRHAEGGFIDVTESFPRGVRIYSLYRAGDVLLAGTDGRSVWRQEAVSSAPSTAATAASATASVTVVPSPFSGSATATVQIAERGNARVALVDAAGREVMRLHDGELAAGRHRFIIDGGGLASGRYFVVVRTAAAEWTAGAVKVD